MIYSNTVRVSPLSTLDFSNVGRLNERELYPSAFRYVQKLTTSDTIHIQLHSDTDQSSYVYLMVMTNDFMSPFRAGGVGEGFKTWTQLSDGNWYADWHIPCNDLEGVLYVDVLSNEGTLMTSWPFSIGSWDDTILLEGGHKNNDLPNTVFPSISSDTIFTLRVEGGFLPDGDEDESEYESFTDQSLESYYVNALPSVKDTMFLGDAQGLPMWMRNKIRLFFCMSYLTTGGYRIVRKGDWTEESTSQRTKTMKINVNVYDSLADEVGISDDNGVLLTTEDGTLLIL